MFSIASLKVSGGELWIASTVPFAIFAVILVWILHLPFFDMTPSMNCMNFKSCHQCLSQFLELGHAGTVFPEDSFEEMSWRKFWGTLNFTCTTQLYVPFVMWPLLLFSVFLGIKHIVLYCGRFILLKKLLHTYMLECEYKHTFNIWHMIYNAYHLWVKMTVELQCMMDSFAVILLRFDCVVIL